MANAEYQRDRREKHKAAGKCAACGRRKPKPGLVTCRDCLARVARFHQKRRADAKLAGLCTQCVSRYPEPGMAICQHCRDRRDVCRSCGNPPAEGKTSCQRCSDRERTRRIAKVTKRGGRLLKCYQCGGLGHRLANCPQRHEYLKSLGLDGQR